MIEKQPTEWALLSADEMAGVQGGFKVIVGRTRRSAPEATAAIELKDPVVTSYQIGVIDD